MQSAEKKKRMSGARGFTLVEMVVAVGLFAVVMLVSVAALLALVDANRKAQALESVINNLNIALDSMVRGARMGSTFHCGSGDLTETQDCASTSDPETNHHVFAFEPLGGDPGDPDDQWVYSYDPVTKRIYRAIGVGGTPLPVTAPEITIESLQFYVIGSTRGDVVQPKVVIVVNGTAGSSQTRTRSAFSIQATAVQRLLDL